MSNINYSKKSDQVRKFWHDNFWIDLSDEDINTWLKKSVKDTVASHANTPIAKPLLEHIINSSEDVLFTPKSLMNEVNKSIQMHGDKYIDGKKFSEIFAAFQLAFAIHLYSKDKLLIALRDSPDIVLMNPYVNGSGYLVYAKIAMEVTKCSTEKEGINETNLYPKFYEYLNRSKFNMRYGLSWLVVPFFSNNINGELFKDFSSFLNTKPTPPFEKIFITELFDGYRVSKVHQIFPNYASIRIDLNRDQSYLY